MVNFDDFKKLELKIGKIEEVQLHPNADRLYVLRVDTGAEKREIVAGIREFYNEPESLLGKQIVILANLEPKSIRGVISQGMLLAVKDDNNLSVLTVDKYIEPGSLVS